MILEQYCDYSNCEIIVRFKKNFVICDQCKENLKKTLKENLHNADKQFSDKFKISNFVSVP